MSSPHNQLDEDIKNLIREGCSTSEVSDQLQEQYPELAREGSELLKRIQAIVRKLRNTGN